MAWLPNYDEDEERGRGQAWTGMGAVAGPAGAAQAQAQAAPAGKFVNFERYINANKGAAEKTAGEMASEVGGKAQASQDALKSAQGAFSSQVAAGSPFGSGQRAPTHPNSAFGRGAPPPAPTQALPASSLNANTAYAGYQMPQVAAPNVTAQTGATGVSRQELAGSGPQIGGGREADISADEARRRAESRYTGPGSLSGMAGYDSLLSGARDAQAGLERLGSISGQQAMLQEKHGKQGGYSAGQSKLDAGLSNAVGRSRFDELRGKYGDLAKAIEQADAMSAQEANAARGFTDDVAGQYADAYGKAEGDRQAQQADADRKAEEARTQQADDAAVAKVGEGDLRTLDDLLGRHSPDDPEIAWLRQSIDQKYGAGTYDALLRRRKRTAAQVSGAVHYNSGAAGGP